MITFLQNLFLKHNKWLFGGLLVVVIVTFVLTIGPQSFFGSQSAGERKALKYYGYDLSSESDQRAMAATAEISAILHPELGLRREQLMDYAYLRVAALGIASQLGIPEPTKEDLAAYVETLMIFKDPQTGAFSAESYNRMLGALENSARYDRESIAMVLREDARIQQVRKALAGPDYSMPYEIRQEYLDNKTSYTVALARFDYAAFTPEIETTDESLLRFYNENPARYEEPELLSVTALLFKAPAHMAEVAEPTEDELQAHFTANKARFEAQLQRPAPAEGEQLPELTLADVRETVVSDWKLQQARRIAAKKSEQFSLRLWQQNIALDSAEFNNLLAEFQVQTLDVAPYAREQSPSMAEVPQQLLNSMWIYANNPKRYFSDIAQTGDGAVVLVSRGLTPSRLPGFEEVRERVVADYTAAEKRRLFAERGEEIRKAILSELGVSTFAAAAESFGLKVESLEPFTGENVPQQLLASTVWDQARFLPQGDVSPMVIQGDTGTLAHIAAKSVPELDPADPDYLAYLEQRSTGLGDALGWARLREITDKSLTALLGTSEVE